MNIFTQISAFFGEPYLAEALNAELYVMNTKYNNFFGGVSNVKGIYCGNNTENINNDDIIIIAFLALQKISKRIENKDFRKIVFIACDTLYCRNYEWCNKFINDNNIQMYLMPDVEPFCSIDYKLIYQYMKIDASLILPKQTNRLLITHSPRGEKKQKVKGTPEIIKIIEELQKKHDFEFKLITGQKMDDGIKEKSRAHIHIDQLIYGNPEVNQSHWGRKFIYNGGLGKSGIEGMLLNCAVITGGLKPKTQPYFDPPPITWTSYNTFYEDLENLIVNESKRNQQIDEQNNWLTLYYNKEFYKTYLNC